MSKQRTVACPPVAVLYNLDARWTPAERQETRGQVAELEDALRLTGHPVLSVPVEDDDIQAALDGCDPDRWIVLNWVEDLPGMEMGDVHAAAVLRHLGYTHTGSCSEVLARSYDKPLCKKVLAAAGVATPPGRIYHSPPASMDWRTFPAIVKAAHAHCSKGITSDSVVLDAGSLAKRVGYVVHELGQPALVEHFVDGREFHVSLWGGSHLQMLPPAEMDFSAFEDVRDRLCTWDSKFNPGSPHFERIEIRLPSLLDQSDLYRLERTCRAACRALGCRDYARVDIRLRGSDFVVLEVNPNPDITKETSFCLAANLLGLSYGELGSRLICLAAARHPVYGQMPALQPQRQQRSRFQQSYHEHEEEESPPVSRVGYGRRA